MRSCGSVFGSIVTCCSNESRACLEDCRKRVHMFALLMCRLCANHSMWINIHSMWFFKYQVYSLRCVLFRQHTVAFSFTNMSTDVTARHVTKVIPSVDGFMYMLHCVQMMLIASFVVDGGYCPMNIQKCQNVNVAVGEYNATGKLATNSLGF